MTDQPEPLKRPFGHPVTLECLEYFVHPGGEPHFEKPFVYRGAVHASNRWLAIRFDRLDPAGIDENPDASERMEKVPWARLDALPDDSPRWSALDDAAGSIWRFGPRPIWERARVQFHLRTMPLVRVGFDAAASLALIQLLARLPRARVWTDTRHADPIFCRWNGGAAILAPLPDFVEMRQAPDFNILTPRKYPATGLPVWKEALPMGRPLPGSKPTPPARPADIHHDDLPVIHHD